MNLFRREDPSTEDCLAELLDAFDVARAVNEAELRRLFDAKNYAGMLDHIRRDLGLDLAVNLVAQRSWGNTLAWIRIPHSLPHRNSPAFKKQKLTVYIQQSFLSRAKFEQLVIALAHELCHIVLESIRHQLKRVEKAVDMTAMILGYRKFYSRGSHVASSRTLSHRLRVFFRRMLTGVTPIYMTRAGYLDRDEVVYVNRMLVMVRHIGTKKWRAE